MTTAPLPSEPVAVSLKCPSCGSVVGTGAAKCQQCGQSMSVGALVAASSPRLANAVTVVVMAGLLVGYLAWCR